MGNKEPKVPLRKYANYFFRLAICPLGQAIRNTWFRLRRWGNEKIVRIISGILFFVCLVVSFLIMSADDTIAQDGRIEVLTAWISSTITIIGIAWTLNHERKENIENHRLTIRPYLIYGLESDDPAVEINLDLSEPLLDEDEYFDSDNVSALDQKFFTRMQQYECLCFYNEIDIHIADYAEGVLDAIIYGENEYYLQRPILLRKNKSYRLKLDQYFFLQKKRNTLPTIDLCITDMCTNTYYYTIRINEGLDSSVELGDGVFRLVGYDVIGCYSRVDSFSKKISKRSEQKERKEFWHGYISNLKALKNLHAVINIDETALQETQREKKES